MVAVNECLAAAAQPIAIDIVDIGCHSDSAAAITFCCGQPAAVSGDNNKPVVAQVDDVTGLDLRRIVEDSAASHIVGVIDISDKVCGVGTAA